MEIDNDLLEGLAARTACPPPIFRKQVAISAQLAGLQEITAAKEEVRNTPL